MDKFNFIAFFLPNIAIFSLKIWYYIIGDMVRTKKSTPTKKSLLPKIALLTNSPLAGAIKSLPNLLNPTAVGIVSSKTILRAAFCRRQNLFFPFAFLAAPWYNDKCVIEFHYCIFTTNT